MLIIATSQFPVSSDIDANTRYIMAQIHRAKRSGAYIIHFCEGSLSGYAGTDFVSFDNFEWPHLILSTQKIMKLAHDLRIWVLLGSSHRLSGRHKPHNCVYIINDLGQIVDRYDKRFCGRSDLNHYSPGNSGCIFTVQGIRCAVLICYEYRYPELVRTYKKQGVQLLFHSFHAGNISSGQLEKMKAQVGTNYFRFNHGNTYPEITMPASMQAAAASNHVWISASNSSARYSCWPAFFVRADGVVTGKLYRHRTGILISTIDLLQPLYDSTQVWRNRAMRGLHHSGRTVRDKRSMNRQAL